MKKNLKPSLVKTKLTSNEEAVFQEWRKSLPKNLQVDTDDYDLRGAWKGGLEPELFDGEYHLGSRDPNSGALLKSTNHPTYEQMITGEIMAGYTPTINLRTGRMESKQMFNGGDLTAAFNTLGGLGAVSPYLAIAGTAGSLISTAIENAAKPSDTRNLYQNVNSQGLMAMGGKINKVNIEGGETISDTDKGQSLFIARGPKHEQGGIDIMANGGIVKSDRIGYNKLGKITTNPDETKTTFAAVDKKINNKLSGLNDMIARRTKELMLKKTENDNMSAVKSMGMGGKIKKMAPGGPILPGGIPGLDGYFQNRLATFQAMRDNPSGQTPNILTGPTDEILPNNVADPNYITGQDEYGEVSMNPGMVDTNMDMWEGNAPPAYEVSNKKVRKPSTGILPKDGEQLSKFAAMSGGIYSALEGLISRPEKDRPRLVGTQFEKNYYNPTQENIANKTALNTVLRNYSGSNTDTINRLAALSGYGERESAIARNKFNYDTNIDRAAASFNLQRDSQNAQIMAGVDIQNAQNRAQTRNLRRQGLGNMFQSMANVGDYSNRQTEQKLKLGMLDDIFANYGITAKDIPALMAALEQGQYFKKNENGN